MLNMTRLLSSHQRSPRALIEQPADVERLGVRFAVELDRRDEGGAEALCVPGGFVAQVHLDRLVRQLQPLQRQRHTLRVGAQAVCVKCELHWRESSLC